jgi:hypothetical protein
MNMQLHVRRLSGYRMGRGTAVPLVKATLRGILPHGSEVPWVPIPLRSTDLDDSPRFKDDACGIRPRRIPFSTGGRRT